jgi:hypothetical protein
MAWPTHAIEGPAAWRGAEMAARTDWIEPLGAAAVDEIGRAVAHARARGLEPATLSRESFPLPTVGPRVAAWLDELDRGRGFLLVRGLPVAAWGDEDAALAWLGLGLHMGALVSQNAAGDLLGHVRDTGADPADPAVRGYKTRERLGFHTDGADVIGLLCLRTARTGGTSRLASSAAVFNEVRRRRPDLVPLLFEPFHFDRNEEQAPGEPPTFALPLCHWDGTRLSTFYIGWYIRSAERHPTTPRLATAQRELIDLIDAVAEDPAVHLDMTFEPGDVQLVKNAVTLHGRTEYVDWDEPARKRHLLRLWVNPRRGFGDADALVRGGIPGKAGARSDADAIGT